MESVQPADINFGYWYFLLQQLVVPVGPHPATLVTPKKRISIILPVSVV